MHYIFNYSVFDSMETVYGTLMSLMYKEFKPEQARNIIDKEQAAFKKNYPTIGSGKSNSDYLPPLQQVNNALKSSLRIVAEYERFTSGKQKMKPDFKTVFRQINEAVTSARILQRSMVSGTIL